jgi:glycosyltransferase involved in cell wall biosynthesis
MVNVDMVGFKTGQEKLDYLRNSMFTIVPSHFYETFGVVVLEAYASGKPVVASATGSLPYIVRPYETGLLFEPQNSNGLAEKVSWLYERPEQIEMMGRKARNLVESTYDSRLRYPALEGIFKDVIANSGMH